MGPVALRCGQDCLQPAQCVERLAYCSPEEGLSDSDRSNSASGSPVTLSLRCHRLSVPPTG
eukprot:scaffold137937_cov172-Phaeocystis_antarctica.AAC.1